MPFTRPQGTITRGRSSGGGFTRSGGGVSVASAPKKASIWDVPGNWIHQGASTAYGLLGALEQSARDLPREAKYAGSELDKRINLPGSGQEGLIDLLIGRSDKLTPAERKSVEDKYRGLAESYRQTYGPLQHGDFSGIYANPFQVTLDALTLLSGGTTLGVRAGLLAGPTARILRAGAEGERVVVPPRGSPFRGYAVNAIDRTLKKLAPETAPAVGEFSRGARVQRVRRIRQAKAVQFEASKFGKLLGKIRNPVPRHAAYLLATLPNPDAIRSEIRRLEAPEPSNPNAAAMIASAQVHAKALPLVEQALADIKAGVKSKDKDVAQVRTIQPEMAKLSAVARRISGSLISDASAAERAYLPLRLASGATFAPDTSGFARLGDKLVAVREGPNGEIRIASVMTNGQLEPGKSGFPNWTKADPNALTEVELKDIPFQIRDKLPQTLQGGKSIEEISSTLDEMGYPHPFYMPEMPDLNAPRVPGSGGGGGLQQIPGEHKRNLGVLREMGRILMDPAALNATFLRRLRYFHYTGLYNDALNAARWHNKHEPIPKGYQILPSPAVATEVELNGERMIAGASPERIGRVARATGEHREWQESILGDSPERTAAIQTADRLFGKEQGAALVNVMDRIAQNSPSGAKEWYRKRIAAFTAGDAQTFMNELRNAAHFQIEPGHRIGLVQGVIRPRRRTSGKKTSFKVVNKGGEIFFRTGPSYVKPLPRGAGSYASINAVREAIVKAGHTEGGEKASMVKTGRDEYELRVYDRTSPDEYSVRKLTMNEARQTLEMGKDHTYRESVDPSETPVFYSDLQNQIAQLPALGLTKENTVGFIRNAMPGGKDKDVTPTEWVESGMDAFFDSYAPGELVPRADLERHFISQLNAYDLEEILRRHDAKLPFHQTRWHDRFSGRLVVRSPDAENPYYELEMHLRQPLWKEVRDRMGLGAGYGRRTYGEPGDAEDYAGKGKVHWASQNVVAHVRFHVITDNEGRRALLVDELQSDWANQWRVILRHGGRGQAERVRQQLQEDYMRIVREEGEDAPDAWAIKEQLDELNEALKDAVAPPPLGKKQVEAMVRRTVRMAHDLDVDRIIITRGDVQAIRNQAYGVTRNGNEVALYREHQNPDELRRQGSDWTADMEGMSHEEVKAFANDPKNIETGIAATFMDLYGGNGKTGRVVKMFQKELGEKGGVKTGVYRGGYADITGTIKRLSRHKWQNAAGEWFQPDLNYSVPPGGRYIDEGTLVMNEDDVLGYIKNIQLNGDGEFHPLDGGPWTPYEKGDGIRVKPDPKGAARWKYNGKMYEERPLPESIEEVVWDNEDLKEGDFVFDGHEVGKVTSVEGDTVRYANDKGEPSIWTYSRNTRPLDIVRQRADVETMADMDGHVIEMTPAAKEKASRPMPYFQKLPWEKLPRGATEILGEDGRTALRFFQGANLDTALEEIAHAAVYDLHPEVQAVFEDFYGGGKKLADWGEVEHERYARGFVQYHREGRSANAALAKAFQKVSEWLQALTQRARSEKMPDEVIQAFDHMHGARNRGMDYEEPDDSLFGPEDALDSDTRVGQELADTFGNNPSIGGALTPADLIGADGLPKKRDSNLVAIVPKNYIRSLRGEFTRASDFSHFMQTKPLAVWRALVLYARPAWLVNNVVGNSLLWVLSNADSAGMKALWAGARESFSPAERAKMDRLMEERFPEQQHGSFGETQLPVYRTGKAGAARTALRGVQAPFYFFRDLDIRYERALRRRMVRAELERSPRMAQRVKDMQGETKDFLQIAQQEAIDPVLADRVSQRVNDALGDYTSMSKFEKNFLRNAFPFYAWLKAMTLIALKLPIDQPIKMNILAQLAQASVESNQEQLQGTPEWMSGFLPLGPEQAGRTPMVTSAMNPFTTPVDVANFVTALGSLKPGMVGARLPGIAPQYEAMYEAISGHDIKTGYPVHPTVAGVGGVPGAAIGAVAALPPFRLAQVLSGTGYSGKPGSPTLYQRRPRDELMRYFGLPYANVSLARARKMQEDWEKRFGAGAGIRP